jgi:hypothetical protein
MLPATFFSNVAGHHQKMLPTTYCQLLPWCKAALRQQLATCCLSLQKNVAGNMLPIVALV